MDSLVLKSDGLKLGLEIQDDKFLSTQLLDLNLKSSDIGSILFNLLISLIKDVSQSLNFLGKFIEISEFQRALIQVSVESVDFFVFLSNDGIESFTFNSQHSKFF